MSSSHVACRPGRHFARHRPAACPSCGHRPSPGTGPSAQTEPDDFDLGVPLARSGSTTHQVRHPGRFGRYKVAALLTDRDRRNGGIVSIVRVYGGFSISSPSDR
jgi:hypothetical protein